MPCESSYLEANGSEVESHNVLVYLKELGEDIGEIDSGGGMIPTDGVPYYGRVETLHKDTAKLCGLLKTKNGAGDPQSFSRITTVVERSSSLG